MRRETAFAESWHARNWPATSACTRSSSPTLAPALCNGCCRRSYRRYPRNASEYLEVDLDVYLYRDRLALVLCRRELVLLHRFEGLLVQPHANAAQQVHVLRIAV